MVPILVCHTWFYNHGVDVIALIVSILTLGLAYKAYRTFLVKKAKENQLEIVLQFISRVHECKNLFRGFGSKSDQWGIMLPTSLFELDNIKARDLPEALFFLDPSIHRDLIRWEFYTEFIHHPLMPKSIVKELTKFELFTTGTKNIAFPMTKKENFSLVGGDWGMDLPSDGYSTIEEYALGDGTPKTEFLNNCALLKASCIEWLKNQGVRDVNL